jgi:hypothetical protein
MQLERRSGRPGPWHRLNKLFLKEVRKQFLLWRALTHETIERYTEQSNALFTDTPESAETHAAAQPEDAGATSGEGAEEPDSAGTD